MRITIEQDGKDPIIHEGVSEFFVCGQKVENQVVVKRFCEWNGTFQSLIGDLYFYLRDLEKRFGREGS